MTIDVVEVVSPVVIESAESITTTVAEAEMATGELADVLDENAIAQLAARAREQACAGRERSHRP